MNGLAIVIGSTVYEYRIYGIYDYRVIIGQSADGKYAVWDIDDYRRPHNGKHFRDKIQAEQEFCRRSFQWMPLTSAATPTRI